MTERGAPIATARAALAAAERYVGDVRAAVRDKVFANGKLDPALLEREQRAAHGYAWCATTAAALEALTGWAEALEAAQAFGEAEQAALTLGFSEHLGRLTGGLAMSQSETVRPADLGAEECARTLADDPAVRTLTSRAGDARETLSDVLRNGGALNDTLGADDLDAARDQFRRFANEKIIPRAHAWHLQNALIPDDVVAEMAELGAFGVTIPKRYDGLGLSRQLNAAITEELSRGWIAAGSLGTRSEIAGELIVQGGTEAQKERWLPLIARGDVLPAAAFTEPDTGSDLASLTARAKLEDGGWSVHGAKTWITHAARSDLFTLLVRTRAGSRGYEGLSMLLVPKTRGTEGDPFPDEGLSGGEIEVLGYRGMREYALSFDGLRVPEDALLGGEEGRGFKQLMATFESARVQTAARAVGVAARAFELGLDYARARRQFAKPLIAFPRVADKLTAGLVEIVMARALTHAAARAKDGGRRCDVEAGMAKLFAARAAWAVADDAVQIHGGAGYALEFEISRVLCDARILSIFEGAAEIQAHVIARGLLAGAD